MSRAKDRLPIDIYRYLAENGPTTACDLAHELNPSYMGNLSGQRIVQYLIKLRGQGKVQAVENTRPCEWMVVKPLNTAEVKE